MNFARCSAGSLNPCNLAVIIAARHRTADRLVSNAVQEPKHRDCIVHNINVRFAKSFVLARTDEAK